MGALYCFGDAGMLWFSTNVAVVGLGEMFGPPGAGGDVTNDVWLRELLE